VSSSQTALVERLLALESTIEHRAGEMAHEASAAAVAATGAVMAAEDRAAACQAAESAALLKPYKAWQPEVEEYHACPKEPKPGELLPYFHSEEGLRASKTDPYLNKMVPVSRKLLGPRPTESAAAATFSTPGVYRAKATTEENLLGGSATDTAAAATDPGTHAHREDIPDISATAHAPDHAGCEDAQRHYCEDVQHAYQHAVALPSIYRQPQAATELNDVFLSREYMALRLPNTSSATLIRARGRDGVEFALGCQELDFGVVPRGTVVGRKIPLQNVSLARARFSVKQVALPLRLTYPRVPVPAGLKVMITAEVAPGGQQELGAWSGCIVVCSALNLIRCPVRAVFVEASVSRGKAVLG
jgi:hypothetical protein